MKALAVVLLAVGIAAAPLTPPDVPSGSPAPSPPQEEAVGGAWYTCAALGVIFGGSIASGNVLGAASSLIAADIYGCI